MKDNQFIARVSSMGDMKIIYIPKDYVGKIKKLEGKQLKITLDEL